MIRQIAKLLKVLSSETAPAHISLAFCLAMVAGFTPLWSLHNILVLLLVLLVRTNLAAFLLGLGVFSALAFALDPLFDLLGQAVLGAEALRGLWTALYQSPWWRLEHFNNSIVMGSLLVSIVLFVPLLLLFNRLIREYREHIVDWVKKTRVAEAIRASRFWGIYREVSGWRG